MRRRLETWSIDAWVLTAPSPCFCRRKLLLARSKAPHSRGRGEKNVPDVVMPCEGKRACFTDRPDQAKAAALPKRSKWAHGLTSSPVQRPSSLKAQHERAFRQGTTRQGSRCSRVERRPRTQTGSRKLKVLSLCITLRANYAGKLGEWETKMHYRDPIHTDTDTHKRTTTEARDEAKTYKNRKEKKGYNHGEGVFKAGA